MNLGHCLCHAYVLEPACDSIFPEIEAFLNESSDLQNALTRIAPKGSGDNYRSVIDWLCVSIHPEHRRACMAFYAGEGPPMREIITELERLKIQARMFVLLIEAYEDFCRERERKWTRGSWGRLCVFARMAA